MKLMNQHVDPTLPRGDFSVVVRGRRFTFLDFRTGAFYSYETAHIEQGAMCDCLYCLRRFGRYGLCVNEPGTEAQRELRTNEHYDKFGKLAKPFSEFASHIGALRGPEPFERGVESISLEQKGSIIGGVNLSQTQVQFHCLLQEPSIKALLLESGKPYFL